MRSLWNALFTSDKSAIRIPSWLLPPVRFAYLVIQEFSRNRCPEKASALGFQTVFSMIPAFALALFFFHMFGDSSNLSPQVERFLFRSLHIDEIYAPQAGPATEPDTEGGMPQPREEQNTEVSQPITLDTKIHDWVDNIYDQLSSGGLTVASFFLLVVAAMQLALTLEKSLNEIWGSLGQRRLVRRIALYWSVLTLGPLLIGLSMYGARQVGLSSSIYELPMHAAGPLLTLYLIYQLMPSASVHPAAAVIGAFVAAVMSQVARYLFGIYLEHATGYGKLYGNLALLPIFLFWLWINWSIVLAGAEVAYTLQNLGRLTAEERRRRGAPFIQPGLMALGLVLHAGRAFQQGKGPVDADELAESSGLPDKLWLRLVNLLRERGILVEAGPEGSHFIPGRPLDSLRVEEIFAAVEDSLVARPDEITHPEHVQLLSLSKLLSQARQHELGQTSIADLLVINGQQPVKPATPTS